ncbi:helix-turn-helix transcriptional regulator [Mesorhizobium dulcispinae]|uniref:helix-turn-helix transcriptional regulator n=1 Tax=Mesorhizobium dulcispinae TaxID=3072316 RepID=UPI002A24D090|nr:helix-turn-helix domain-containing protein [Mesorhizobium sp. VK23D]MDX8517954.1 helix-turn-helix domain-containing protein [Mesorhizobium sp. VK23D]
MANLRVRDAATYCGLSKSTLDKFRCYGGGPAYIQLGSIGAVIYSTDDLDKWLAANRRASNDNARAMSVAA